MKQSYTLDEYNSARSVVGDTIAELGGKDSRVWLLTPDIGFGCKEFHEKYPDRFIDTGIAEQDVVGVSAGLAYDGNIPFIIGMMPFMSMRALEQVRTDVCYPKLPVRIIANYSGLTGNGGSTHYAMEDMALYSSLVNMTVCAASDPVQLRQIIEKSLYYEGPLSIRIDPGKENRVLYTAEDRFEIGKGHLARDGKDITIIACGEMVKPAKDAAAALKAMGISCRVLDMYCIKPLDEEAIVRMAGNAKAVLTVEEHAPFGGLGSMVAQVTGRECPRKVVNMSLPDAPVITGTSKEVFDYYGLNAEGIANKAKEILK